MNKDKFFEYLNNPNLLDSNSINELIELTEQYPYFQAGQMLLAKNLHISNDIKYENQLRLTSLLINNRRKFYYLINDKTNENTEQIIEINNIQTEFIKEETIKINEDFIIEEITSDSEEKQEEINEIENFIDLAINEETVFTENNILEETIIENKTELIENIINQPEIETIIEQENLEIVEEKISSEQEIDVITGTDLIKEEVVEENLIIPQEEIIDTTVELNEVISENATDDNATKVSNNIADEILERIANLRKSFENEASEMNESIADIILRKAAEAKIKNSEESVSELIIPDVENITTEPILIDSENLFENTIIENQIEELENIEVRESEISIEPETNIVESEEKIEINTEVSDIDDKIEIEKIEATFNEEQLSDENFDYLNIVEKEHLESSIPEIKEESKSKEKNIDQKHDFNKWLDLLSDESSEKNELHEEIIQNQSPSDLIDKFIKEEPKIIPKKIINENLANVKPNKSVDLSDGFITETLAKIYIKQGHFDKAISIYEKLSLTNSEKSTYFAKKINEIKNIHLNK